MTIRAEFSENYDDIKQSLFADWGDVAEDLIDQDGYELPSDAIYVVLMDDDKVMGYQLYLQQNAITYEIHTVIKDEYKGQTISFMSQRHGWGLMFDETSCLKIVAEIPVYREDVIKYARLLGMKVEGKNSKSWLRYGNVWDQIRLGISEDEFYQASSGRSNWNNG